MLAAKPIYSVQLDFFSGPLDLLLHLVHQREVSVAEVNMAEICAQYLEIVSSAALIDLDKATEYLVIAATLTAMKSEAILPGEHVTTGDDAGESYDPNFFESLRERLKAYEATKQRARRLLEFPQLGQNTFVRGNKEELVQPVEIYAEGNAESLASMFLRLLKRIGLNSELFHIKLEPVSVVNFMMKIVDRLSSSVKLTSFLSLTRALHSGEKKGPRATVIGSFMAVLELVRRGVVIVKEEEEGDFQLAFCSAEGRSVVLSEQEFNEIEGIPSNVVRLPSPREAESESELEDVRKEANLG